MHPTNGQPENQPSPESVEERIERIEIRNFQAETRLIDAGKRRDHFRLVFDIVKWTVIGAAVVLATIAAKHVDII